MVYRAEEKIFETEVKKYLKKQGAWYVKYWGGGKFTTPGIPDLLCCVRGRFVAIETKGPKGKPTEQQLEKIQAIRAAGGVAVVLYPSAFEEFKAWCEDGFVGNKPVIMK